MFKQSGQTFIHLTSVHLPFVTLQWRRVWAIGSYPITSRRSACAPEALTGLSPAGFTQTIQNYVNTSLFIFIKIPTWATPNSYSCYSRLSAASCRNALFWYSLQAVGLPARSLQGSSGLSSQRLLLRPRDCYANIQWPRCTADCQLKQFRFSVLLTSPCGLYNRTRLRAGYPLLFGGWFIHIHACWLNTLHMVIQVAWTSVGYEHSVCCYAKGLHDICRTHVTSAPHCSCRTSKHFAGTVRLPTL